MSNGMWLLWTVLVQVHRVGDGGEGRGVTSTAAAEEGGTEGRGADTNQEDREGVEVGDNVGL